METQNSIEKMQVWKETLFRCKNQRLKCYKEAAKWQRKGKMENENGRKTWRVEIRIFGTLLWELDSPFILSETKNPPLCAQCPFVAWEESSVHNFLHGECEVSEKMHNEVH